MSGAAVDVYPTEPFTNGEGFETELSDCHNTILTPHIGGSTEEAQSSIGTEVATALVKFIKTGSSLSSVNFPELDLRLTAGNLIRVINIHQNVPGVLRQINKVLSEFNIEKQQCDSKESIAFFMADLTFETEKDINAIYELLDGIKESISTRILYSS